MGCRSSCPVRPTVIHSRFRLLPVIALPAVVAASILLPGCQPATKPPGTRAVTVVESIEVKPEPAAAPATQAVDPGKQAADAAKAQADQAIAAAGRDLTLPATATAAAPTAPAAPTTPVAATSAAAEPVAAPAVATDNVANPGAPAPAALEEVLLGDPSLTSGVPGSGPITLEQIEAWLADPKNSAILQPVLPLGLSQGAAQITGLEGNPLTRAKIELGRQLYFDPRLSADSTVSCASCHNPAEGYSAHTQTGVGIRGQKGGRNSPVSFNRILSGKQFWDGRVDSLEAQAVGPIANPTEMGFTHEGVVKRLDSMPVYKRQFEAIFGEVSIDRVGQAIAAFERVLVTAPSAYDFGEQLRPFAALDADDIADDPDLAKQFAAAKEAAAAHPMSESARRGREIFFTEKGNCTACHVGANLADEKYHNIGIGMDKAEPDLGRYAISKDEKDKGAFKTPTVRNAALSAPYMHDGSLATLEEVVEWYDKGGHPNPHLSDKIRPLKLTAEEKADLVEFMKACTGPTPTVEVSRLPADG